MVLKGLWNMMCCFSLGLVMHTTQNQAALMIWALPSLVYGIGRSQAFHNT